MTEETATGMALRAIRNEIIEQCAKVADQAKPGFCGDSRDELVWATAERIANSIRDLVSSQPERGNE